MALEVTVSTLLCFASFFSSLHCGCGHMLVLALLCLLKSILDDCMLVLNQQSMSVEAWNSRQTIGNRMAWPCLLPVWANRRSFLNQFPPFLFLEQQNLGTDEILLCYVTCVYWIAVAKCRGRNSSHNSWAWNIQLWKLSWIFWLNIRFKSIMPYKHYMADNNVVGASVRRLGGSPTSILGVVD
jgi:hypothetical protein